LASAATKDVVTRCSPTGLQERPGALDFRQQLPVDRDAASYRTLINAYKKMLSDLPDDDVKAIFAGNARRFYRL
jgi:hypothetical protein